MITLHVAKQTVKWTDYCVASGYDAPKVFYKILFEIYNCEYGPINEDGVYESSQEYEILRDSLVDVRNSIIQRDKRYEANKHKMAEALVDIDMTIDDFTKCLTRLIEESDQENDWVLLSWF